MPKTKRPKSLFSLTLSCVTKNVDTLCEREERRESGIHLSKLGTHCFTNPIYKRCDIYFILM